MPFTANDPIHAMLGIDANNFGTQRYLRERNISSSSPSSLHVVKQPKTKAAAASPVTFTSIVYAPPPDAEAFTLVRSLAPRLTNPPHELCSPPCEPEPLRPLTNIVLHASSVQVAELVQKGEAYHEDQPKKPGNTCLIHAMNNFAGCKIISFEIACAFAEHFEQKVELHGTENEKAAVQLSKPFFDRTGNFLFEIAGLYFKFLIGADKLVSVPVTTQRVAWALWKHSACIVHTGSDGGAHYSCLEFNSGYVLMKDSLKVQIGSLTHDRRCAHACPI
jgi:hypothetical protein